MIGIAATVAYLLVGGYIAIVKTDWSGFGNLESMDIMFIGLATCLIAVMWPFVLIGKIVLKVQK